MKNRISRRGEFCHLREVKFIESESTLGDGRGQELGDAELVFNGDRVSV